jgi:hypothetical protein
LAINILPVTWQSDGGAAGKFCYTEPTAPPAIVSLQAYQLRRLPRLS